MADKLLSPGEVAQMLGVDPKTVARYAIAGKLPSIRTLGGHRRFRSSDIEAIVAQFDAFVADVREADK